MSSRENALSAKVGGAQMSEEEFEKCLAAAERKIATASIGFSDRVMPDLDEAMEAVAKLASGGNGDDPVKIIFRVVHDLKGQGTTFGFPLVTHIAGLLCDFIRATDSSRSAGFADVTRAHLATLILLLKQDIKGEGDAATQELVEKLTLAVQRVK